MALQKLIVGPFAAIYVGDSEVSSPLTKLTGITTGPMELTYEVPEKFVASQGNSVQNGDATLKVTATFLSDDPEAMKLAMGNLPSTAEEDDVPQFKTLSVLLIHNDGELDKHSVYIPKCYFNKKVILNYAKTATTNLPVTINSENPNRFVKLYYKRTNSELATIMGSKNPL